MRKCVFEQIRTAQIKFLIRLQSILVISNSQGLSVILRDIRTSTYKVCRIEEVYIIGLLKLEIYCKYYEKEEKLILREQFRLFSQHFVACCWIFMFRQGPDFHFEISGFSR